MAEAGVRPGDAPAADRRASPPVPHRRWPMHCAARRRISACLASERSLHAMDADGTTTAIISFPNSDIVEF